MKKNTSNLSSLNQTSLIVKAEHICAQTLFRSDVKSNVKNGQLEHGYASTYMYIYVCLRIWIVYVLFSTIVYFFVAFLHIYSRRKIYLGQENYNKWKVELW